MEYSAIALFSSIIREFISNPLEGYLANISLDMEGLIIIIFIIQYWPAIMHTLTFGIVGGAYKSGEFPALGSLLYLFVFWANNKVLSFIVTTFGNIGIIPVIIIFIIICVFEFIGMCKLRAGILRRKLLYLRRQKMKEESIQNQIMISMGIPVLYRYMPEQYVDDFFKTGNFMISNFNRCKQLEDEARRDMNEGKNNFNGKAEKYRIEMQMGIGDNPFLVCTSLYAPTKDYKCCIKINNPIEFAKCISDKLIQKGYNITNIDLGPCFYSDKSFNGSIDKRDIETILNAENNSFDFSVLWKMANDINNNPKNMFFNKDLKFMHEQEYRMVFEYNNAETVSEPIFINISEAIKYCEKEVFTEKEDYDN